MSNAKAVPAKAAAPEKPAQKQSELGHIIRLLRRFVKGQGQPFVLGFLLLLAETLTALADGLPLAYVINYLTDPKKNPDVQTLVQSWTGLRLPAFASPLVMTVGAMAALVVIIAMLNSLTDSLSEIYLAKGGRLLGFNMRVALYSHLQKLSLSFYGKQRTGDLLTRVTGDVSAIEEFMTSSLSDIVGGILTLVGTLLFLLFYSPQMALVALILVPLLASISNYFSQRVKAASKKARAREGDLAASAQEMLTSIRVIQVYGSGSSQIEQFSKQSAKTMEASLEAAGIQARFSFTFKVIESAILALIICLGVFLNLQNLIALGTLVLLVKKIDDMFKPTKKIIKEWNTVGKIYASVERIAELMDRAPAVQDAPNALQAPRFQGFIEFKHVSFAYMPEPEDLKGGAAAQPRLALRDVNFSIAPGEVVALVGGSGAGKSTIVQLLPRLYDPHIGAITVDGQDLRAFTLESLRGQMSMVLQEAILFTGTVAENISYGRPNATREEIIAAAMQASAHEFIEKLPDGYDTVLSERASNLSGGQRQRIAIARAFIRNTPILILDEPTTGLDAESTELVQLALRSLMRGKATVIISHDLNLIRQADKIIAIKEGAVEQVGTHKDLLKRGGLYADLYSKQFGDVVAEQGGQMSSTPALAEPARPAKPAALPKPPVPSVLDEDEPEEDEDEVEVVTPKAFQTLIGKALPTPVSQKAFQTLMMQAVPAAPAQPAPAAPAAPAPAPAAQAAPPPAPAAAPAPAARSPQQAQVMRALPPQQPAAPPPAAAQPAPPAPQPPAPQSPTPPRAAPTALHKTPLPMPRPVQPNQPPAQQPPAPPTPAQPAATFETTMLRAIPPTPPEAQAATGRTELQPAPKLAQPPVQAGQAGRSGLRGERLDLLNSQAFREEFPSAAIAFDPAAMREQIQATLFGKARPNYTIEKCELDQATYLPREGVALRYEVVAKDRITLQTIQPMVVGMVFANQLRCALYMRDKLAPLVELMRGRPEITPFATPAAIIEPLNMILHVFPIDGELPALVPATDPQHMAELFREALPEAHDSALEVERCKVELVDYARRYRAVLRYQVDGKQPGTSRAERRTVYGKVFTDNTGALAGPVTAALRERLQNIGARYRFDVPRTLAWRPDMQLVLLEAIPGEPVISDLLKARLRGKPATPGMLSLEEMIDVCAQVAATLHTSEIKLGRRRSLDDDLATLRQGFADMARYSPELAGRLIGWLEQLSAYAE